MSQRWAIPGLLALSVLSCTRAVDAPPHVVTHRPPTRKDIIEAVLASQSVRLTVDPSCERVGTEQTDSTIGAYLSGFLAELDNKDDKNWLETKVEKVRTESGLSVWRSELIVRHSAGEDEWGWGVRFDVRDDDGAVVRESFECIGAG